MQGAKTQGAGDPRSPARTPPPSPSCEIIACKCCWGLCTGLGGRKGGSWGVGGLEAVLGGSESIWGAAQGLGGPLASSRGAGEAPGGASIRWVRVRAGLGPKAPPGCRRRVQAQVGSWAGGASRARRRPAHPARCSPRTRRCSAGASTWLLVPPRSRCRFGSRCRCRSLEAGRAGGGGGGASALTGPAAAPRPDPLRPAPRPECAGVRGQVTGQVTWKGGRRRRHLG